MPFYNKTLNIANCHSLREVCFQFNCKIRLRDFDHLIFDRFSSQDYRSNAEEFPEFFPSGVFEAVWWAAVTMTTVGMYHFSLLVIRDMKLTVIFIHNYNYQ